MKRIIVYICIALLGTGLIGCNKGTGDYDTVKRSNQDISNSKESDETKGNQETQKTNQDLQLRSIYTSEYGTGSRSSMNDTGYYYIDTGVDMEGYEMKDGRKAYHLMYMDFATRQEVYLCNNAGCNHDTESCTSVLISEELGSGVVIFLHNNYLYLLDKDYDKDGYLETSYIVENDGAGELRDIESRQAVLYRMNPDGTDRKRVYEFDANLTISQCLLEDNGGLYFVTKKIETEDVKNSSYYTSTESKLVRLDTTSWEMEEVLNLQFDEDNSDWNIYDAFDSYIVLNRILYNHKISMEDRIKEIEDDNITRENLLKSKDQFAIVNIKDGELKEVCSFENKYCNSYALKDGVLYAGSDKDNKIYQIDLKTGKQEVFTELEENSICRILDNHLWCGGWNGKESVWYFVDCEDKTVNESHLANKSLGWDLEIIGETEDYYLVIYDYDAKSNGDGSYDIYQNKYALIAKEDLYNSKDNFIPIEMAGSGIEF